jgi:hypothetical protein
VRPNVNIDADDLEQVDAYAADNGLRRAEALARLITSALETEGYDA